MYKFALSQIVKDKETGFTGAVFARDKDTPGCNYYVVVVVHPDDGTIGDYQYLAESQLITK